MPQQNESDVLGDDLDVLRFDHALWDCRTTQRATCFPRALLTKSVVSSRGD
jgi:hypothetical protein